MEDEETDQEEDVKLEWMLKSEPIPKQKCTAVNAVGVVSSSQDEETQVGRNRMWVLFVKKNLFIKFRMYTSL